MAMGGKGSGRRTDRERRRQAARLRAEGLTLAQIAHELGVTPQAVHQLLHPRGQPASAAQVSLCCRDYRKPICPARQGMRTAKRAVCLACLAQRPGVDFGQRLLAFRLAWGLTGGELAEALGVPLGTVRYWERHRDGLVRWSDLLRLVEFFGPEFLPAR
jgi:transcriptional regulator with XRE-family HTH domain